jgi:hypothetical protein
VSAIEEVAVGGDAAAGGAHGAHGAQGACGNCGAPLDGAFCAACGQKRLAPGDRTLGHLLAEGFRKVTDLDGTFLRSLRLLLFRPGLLSREYMDDRRVRYASPISLFLLANVLYFVSPAMSDFNLPFADQVPGAMAVQSRDPAQAPLPEARARLLERRGGQLHSPWTHTLVERKLASKQARDPSYDLPSLARDYDREAAVVGKVLIVAHVPIIALALALAYARRRRLFVEHTVVALHQFTFLLLFAQLFLAPMEWLVNRLGVSFPPPSGRILGFALVALVFGYILVACRTAYRTGWGGALLGLAAVLVGVMVANIVVYRALQFLVTLALI